MKKVELATNEDGHASYLLRGESNGVHYLLKLDEESLSKPAEFMQGLNVELEFLLNDFARELLKKNKVDEN